MILQKVSEMFSALITEHQLAPEVVRVTVEPLSPQQAIGSPQREDFALLEGREVMIEAEFRGSFGQAFTDRPQRFEGTIDEVQHLSLDTTSDRAIFISTLNVVTSYLGIAQRTRHCRDSEPELCGSKIAHRLLTDFGRTKVGLVGFQPAILENLVQSFGVQDVRCIDLNPKNIGRYKFGVEVWDGKTETAKVIDWCGIMLVTSSAIVNNTLDEIYELAVISQKKPLVTYGVTGAGVSALLDLKRICTLGH